MLREPGGVDLPRPGVRVRSVEKHDPGSPRTVREDALEVVLGLARLREDDRLALGPQLRGLVHRDVQRLEERVPLRVALDRHGKIGKGVQIGDLGLDRRTLSGSQRRARRLVIPLLPGFLKGFVILREVVLRGFRRLAGAQAVLKTGGDRRQGTGDGEGRRGEKLPQDQRHQRPLPARQRQQIRSTEVLGHQLVERVFRLRGGEFLNHRKAVRVGDVASHLASQGSRAERLQPSL